MSKSNLHYFNKMCQGKVDNPVSVGSGHPVLLHCSLKCEKCTDKTVLFKCTACFTGFVGEAS